MDDASGTSLPPDEEFDAWHFYTEGGKEKKRPADESTLPSSSVAKRPTGEPNNNPEETTGTPTQDGQTHEQSKSLPHGTNDISGTYHINPAFSQLQSVENQKFIYPKVFARPIENRPPPPPPTANRFENLSIEDSSMDIDRTSQEPDQTQTEQRTTPPLTKTNRPKIGSIHVDNEGLLHPQRLLQDLLQITPDGFYAKSTKSELIILPRTPETYKKLLKTLEDIELTPDKRQKYFRANLYYHHHRMTEEQRTKLVIKGLSQNMDIDDMKNELLHQGLKFHHLSEMKKRNPDGTLTGLGLYVLETNKSDAPEIKTNLRYLLHHKVTINDYLQTTHVPRCDNCQLLYHTKHYCHRQTICGKCSDHHHTSSCPNNFYKCSNCQSDHPAYSAQCPVLLKAKEDKLKTIQQRQTLTGFVVWLAVEV